MKVLKKIGLSLLWISFALPAAAMDPFGVYEQRDEPSCRTKSLSEPLDLWEVMEIAVCQNPSLKVSYLASKVSGAEYGQSLAAYLPSLDGTASLTQSNTKVDGGTSDDQTDVGASLSLNWLLLDFGGRSATADQFKAYLTSAYYTYDNSLQTLLYNVAESFFSVLSAEENYEGLLESEKASQKAYEEASSRFNLGLVPLSDKLQAETAYAQAKLSSTVAQKEIAIQRGNLAHLMNLPPYTPLKLNRRDEKIQDTENVDEIEKLIEKALANRPDYKARELAKKAAELDIEIARSDGLPTLSANAGAGVGDDLRQGRDTKYNSSAGLRLSVPIFTGFQQSYKIGQAVYQYEQAQNELTSLKNTIENEVWAAVQDYKTSFRTHTISQTLLKSAEESERVAFASYKVGRVNILTLLDAQAQLAEARIEFSTSFYNFLIAKNNLMRVLGQMEARS